MQALLSNPFKSGIQIDGTEVSSHTMFWHHLGPARKLIEGLRPIDLEIGETASATNGDIWFWRVDLPEILTALTRLRDLAIEDELGYSLGHAQSALYGLKQQREVNEMNSVPFNEEKELTEAQERVDRYLVLNSVVPTVQQALNEYFGDPQEWKHLGVEEANKKWENEPMTLTVQPQPTPELLYNAEAEGNPSSNIQRVEYDAVNRILMVSFTSGSMYRYFDVSPKTANGMRQARSKGSFLNQAIKQGGYKFERFG